MYHFIEVRFVRVRVRQRRVRQPDGQHDVRGGRYCKPHHDRIHQGKRVRERAR